MGRLATSIVKWCGADGSPGQEPPLTGQPHSRLRALKRHRPWRGRLLSSRRFWLLSMRLHKQGHPLAARAVRNLNSLLYSNSLPVDATVSPDIELLHHAFGTVIHGKVTIGRRVKIHQNVTLAVRPPRDAPHGIVIEDDVSIGANSVVITRRTRGIHIGRGARIGAGVVVTSDVSENMIAVSAPPRILPRASAETETAPRPI